MSAAAAASEEADEVRQGRRTLPFVAVYCAKGFAIRLSVRSVLSGKKKKLLSIGPDPAAKGNKGNETAPSR